jgi:hypothetical protein
MLKTAELKRLRKWLRDNALNAEEREFVDSLTTDELQAVARFLVGNGVALEGGVPRDPEHAERYLDGAYIDVHATRLGRVFRG